jgi:hypothetical protein
MTGQFDNCTVFRRRSVPWSTCCEEWLRRGHYEIAADHHRNRRFAAAFRQLATAI